MKYRFLIVLVGLVFSASIIAQNGGVLIGHNPDSNSPDESAILELFSSEKGLLIPRTTISSIINPANGLLIFDTDSTQFMYYDGTEWMSLVNKLTVTNATTELKLLVDSKIDSITELFLDMDKLQALQMDTIKSVIAESVVVQDLLNDSIFKSINANTSVDTIQSLEIDTLNTILSQIDGDGLSSDTSVLKVNVSTGLEITDDTLRIVTGDSAQVMVTTGDGNNVEWVNREEIGKPLLAGNNIKVDDVDGKNIVSLQDTVTLKTLVFDTDSVSSVAKATDWGIVTPYDSTYISTVAYTHKALKEGGDEIDFVYGEKKITRAGLSGLTGTALNAGNVEEFLKKVFFPVSTPFINLLSYDNGTVSAQSSQSVDAVTKQVSSTVGTVTLPYSIWKDATDLTFNFEVVNQSLTDDSEDTPVSLIEMTKGGVGIETYTIPSGDELKDTIKGNVTVGIDNLDKNPTGTTTTSLALKIEDSYPNMQSLDMNFVMSNAIQATVASVNAGSDLVFDGNDQTFNLNWTINKGDETLTSVKVDGVDVALNATTSTVTLPANVDSKTYTVATTGDIYNQEVSNTDTKYWSFDCPYGFVSLGSTGVDDADKLANTVNSLVADPVALKAAISNGASASSIGFGAAGANYFINGEVTQNNGYEFDLQAASGKVFLVFLFPKRNVTDISTWKMTSYNSLSGNYDPLTNFEVKEVPNYVGTESYYMVYSTFIKINASGSEYYKLSKN